MLELGAFRRSLGALCQPRDDSVIFPAKLRGMKKIISTTEAPAAIGPYSQAVRAGSLVFCAGQVPLDPKTGQIVSEDIAEQTRRVLDSVTAILKAE